MSVGPVLCPVVIGRDGELRVLRQALDSALAGHGAVLCVSGEAGIGKSRLAREVAEQARRLAARTLVGRAVPAGTATPYRPWTEALLAALRNGARLPEDAALAPWLPALTAVVPTLRSGTSGTGGAGGGDPSSAVRGEAVLWLLRHLARSSDPGTGAPAAGLMVVLEDLQWADPDTLAVLEYLADNLAAEPVLVAATVRSEDPSPAMELVRRLHARRAITELALGRLGPGEVAAMVRACLPDGADAGVVSAVTRVADGVPFLVEEVLASPGVPASFAASVTDRLAGLRPEEQGVLYAAAVLGRGFDWRLLAPITGTGPQVVDSALEKGMRAQLLRAEGGAFRFRHALTREALLSGLLPRRRAAIAAAALTALDTGDPLLGEDQRDVAAELAEHAGDRARAGTLLLESGASALARGALDTAVATLTRALPHLADDDRARAQLLLMEALGLAGRVDEAITAGEQLIAQLHSRDAPAPARAQVHIRLAQAAVAATRWPTASAHLDAATELQRGAGDLSGQHEVAVLAAEVALARDDTDRATALAARVLADPDSEPELRCHAWELTGRVRRLTDLTAARDGFDQALGIAEQAGLALARLRALHELGTIDLLHHAGTARLLQARGQAQQLGAVSTVAVLDLQLSAAATCRFRLDEEGAYAHEAVAIAEPLGMTQILATALLQVADHHGLRGEPERMQRYLARAAASAPRDEVIDAFGWGVRAMCAVLHGERSAAVAQFSRAASMLRGLPHANPAYFRGVWPLLAAVVGDTRAAGAVEDNRRAGLERFVAHGGFLGYAEAVLAGRRGDRARARELADTADAELADYPGWVDLARLLAAEAGLAGGWGRPRRWLAAARSGFTELGLTEPARRCQALLVPPRAARWERFGLTPRETQVLELLAAGQANKDIAGRLHLSHRTVEKHVEAVLRKTATSSRTQLVALALTEPDPPR